MLVEQCPRSRIYIVGSVEHDKMLGENGYVHFRCRLVKAVLSKRGSRQLKKVDARMGSAKVERL